ncbi:riboflavin biosynthesis protein RibF [Lactobacillus taiwanensis]|uniref:riboflavin biosynthesis protein RibF n=1 Tax=Lactobacillus taiwanensis TaxID=508451 RepID=UPI000B98DF34|nr:riboflavin biosynthesis protein RibF [Lactobacillus taiwanensis]OYR95619.1 riboflavin biosynthesis protein RibF [Lactobacillus taiwanensis]OYR99985.1 riboflavin biosynthesis protein RibF [Lactobacillus taiwanensis]OYS16082.1 riboflavin biosynthesis protein RibF [Lactobacillus taiwanensis]OYS16431.1 riboflavin biosynthesis protein RibF [Lactobacillus taiwanensis]OYS31064.1 riboflavin biosynthesis protein RibF [Lactobacillus taiwanensis]
MKIITLDYPITASITNEKVVLTLGFFDGVHIGHQKLIKDAKLIAEKKNLPLMVMTFDKHPKEIYKNDHKFVYLETEREKEHKMEKLGVDYLVIIKFTKEFSQLSPQDFVDQVVMKLKADTVVVGFDYTYGPKEIANVKNLPKFAKDRFKIVVEPKQAIDKIKVGSTFIRKVIQRGNVELAAALLGQPYETSGIIVHGFRRGHKIGFPTANLEIEGSKVLPAEGVYATRAKINGKWHDAMTSVGYNETFKTNHGLTIETNIFDFDEEAYGKQLTLAWYKFMRKNEKFSGIEDLSRQLDQDKQNIKQYFYELEK